MILAVSSDAAHGLAEVGLADGGRRDSSRQVVALGAEEEALDMGVRPEHEG